MKYFIFILIVFFGFNTYAQNFTTTQSFINYIEGEWEKEDIPIIEDFNTFKFLRFNFERIIGSDSNVNVSVYTNGTNTLLIGQDCTTRSVNIDQDSTSSFAFLNLHPNNASLMFRFDSIDNNHFKLKIKMWYWDDYGGIYNFKRVSSNDTLVVGSSCDSVDIINSILPFGCNGDSIYTNVDYSTTYLLERSTLDSAEVGVTIQSYPTQSGCDSIVVLTVNLLDSATLDLATFLLGEWEWDYTQHGWGYFFADSFSYTYTMKIFENDSINFLPYSVYFNDTLGFCSSFYLQSNSRLDNAWYNSFLFDGGIYRVYLVDSITIALEELFISDGPTHYWKKLANSTATAISIATCNLNEVGIDTVIGNLCDSNMVITNTYLDCPSSINSLTLQIISIYPNPSSNIVEFVIDEKITKIEVYDTGGKKLKVSYEIGSNSLDISKLNNGLYFVKLSNEINAYIGKFVKN